MTAQLHTGSRTITIGADFLVWDVPCRVVLTDPWRLREAREVLCREISELDRRRRETCPAHPGPFPYGATTAPAGGAIHHRLRASDGLQASRGRRRPLCVDPAPSLAAAAVQQCAEAVAEAASCGVLVALGGDLAVAGLAPAGGWRIALPAVPDTAPTVLAIDGGALCALGLPTDGPLRKLVATGTARPIEPLWRHLVVLGATAPAANAAVSGALLRGAAAGPWLAGCGLGARLVDARGQEVGCWPGRASTRVRPA
jgi:hypothetical protein